MAKLQQRIIILGRLEKWFVPTGRMQQSAVRGAPPFPEVKEVLAPRSLYWARRERQGDLKKAQAYAKAKGYEVMVYPKGTKRPLDKAIARIRELHGG